MKHMKLVAHLASFSVVLATGMLPSVASAQLGALGPSTAAIPGVAALGPPWRSILSTTSPSSSVPMAR